MTNITESNINHDEKKLKRIKRKTIFFKKQERSFKKEINLKRTE